MVIKCQWLMSRSLMDFNNSKLVKDREDKFKEVLNYQTNKTHHHLAEEAIPPKI